MCRIPGCLFVVSPYLFVDGTEQFVNLHLLVDEAEQCSVPKKKKFGRHVYLEALIYSFMLYGHVKINVSIAVQSLC